MRTLRILSVIPVVVMGGAIANGVVSGELSAEGRAIWALAWGKVTLIDLYVGLALFGGWVAIRERRPARIGGWWLALAVTGNLAAAVYLVLATFRSSSLEELLLGARAVAE